MEEDGPKMVEVYQKRKEKSVYTQITLAFLSNFSNIAPGMSIGFSAVAIPALKNLDDQQISWFASIASLATPLGCILSGPIADRYGRKCSIAVVNIAAFIGWLIVASAYHLPNQQYEILLVGRFLTGLSTGLCGTPAAVYMAEVASSKLRSVFTTWVSLFYAIGIFKVYLLGLILKDDWGTISLIAAVCPIIGLIFLKLFIPESPPWLITKQRLDEAKKNMCRLYGTQTYTAEVREEIETLIANRPIKKEIQQKTLMQQFVKKLKMLMKKNFLKPYAMVLTFFFFQQFTGIFAIMFYAIDIVKGAKVELDPYITIVIIAVVRLIAMILLSFFSKHFGRRPLSIMSGSGIALSMLILGSYILAVKQGLITQEQEKSLSFIPLSLLIFYFFISTMGFYPLPFALASEVYPGNIRGTASGISSGSNFLFNFLIVKLYPTMVSNIGAHGVFYFYGTLGLIGTLFVFCFLPETRGKSLEEIQAFFVGKKTEPILKKPESA
ncbi:facilitated trehalose transporter Tret1-like [Anthonomus grandis grandis]|uniref:facilitated trehalose transporter Tret1-like n=1 Tax=Anthonomus grandis grandis TaxID=2921223 RepID=UPI0021653934|nr:facilitated trehalose transporter Tret1-like [Anthonomus grandis grandis]XP_050301957.1 facilitated trehalose transporter Tret1-like [Anthonomus grandis grandis]